MGSWPDQRESTISPRSVRVGRTLPPLAPTDLRRPTPVARFASLWSLVWKTTSTSFAANPLGASIRVLLLSPTRPLRARALVSAGRPHTAAFVERPPPPPSADVEKPLPSLGDSPRLPIGSLAGAGECSAQGFLWSNSSDRPTLQRGDDVSNHRRAVGCCSRGSYRDECERRVDGDNDLSA